MPQPQTAADPTAAFFAPSNPGAELARVRDMAATAAGTIGMARSLTESGRRVDLDGLERWIGQLVARIIDLPPAEGSSLRPLLESLLHDLDQLEASLRPHPPPD